LITFFQSTKLHLSAPAVEIMSDYLKSSIMHFVIPAAAVCICV